MGRIIPLSNKTPGQLAGGSYRYCYRRPGRKPGVFRNCYSMGAHYYVQYKKEIFKQIGEQL